MKKFCLATLILACSILLLGCSVWGNDKQSKNPEYHYNDSGEKYSFVLQFRQSGTSTEIADGDAFAHSTIDGELIYEWEIPVYGNTVYECVEKFFEGREDSITFRLSQHKFYMFHDCTLLDGTNYNLETVYVAVDGVYANCANYQTVFGNDGVIGTEDDLKILTLVYEGWLY